MIEKLLISLSLSTFTLGTYLIWFSKKNIFNHANLGFCFVAYIVPPFVIDFTVYATPEIYTLYLLINVLGAAFFITGMFLGYRWRPLILVNTVIKYNFLNSVYFDDERVGSILKIVNRIFIIGLIGLVVSYILMGFIPMFSADPYLAKFFKGQYQAPYQRVAFLYRTSRQFIEFFIPVKVLEIILKRRVKDMLLVAAAITLIAISLNRGPIAGGVLAAIAIVVALKNKNLPFWLFVSFVFLTFLVGSGVLYVIAVLFPSNEEIALLTNDRTFFEAVAFGAPDIVDQLGFLTAYERSGGHYTYGLTFLGGLIPFNFPWNPSIYTLKILNDTNDVSEVASGGLRIPISMWGYVSFGWAGVAFVPFIAAFFIGYITRKIKMVVDKFEANRNGYLVFFIIFFMYNNIGVVFTNYTYLSIYLLPGFIVYYVIIKLSKQRKPIKVV